MDKSIFNKKTVTIGVVMVIIITISAFCALIPVNKSHDKQSSYWMEFLSDNTPICNLSIPGSHNSGATHSIFDVSGKCQDLSVKSQLEIGVRFLDLRLQLINDEFEIVHSFVKQGLKFESVVNDIHNFLTKNPTEFLFVSIKEEESAVNSTLTFKDAFVNEIKPLSEMIFKGDKLPQKVGDVRGKIVLIARTNVELGISAYSGWKDNDSFELGSLYVQDYYCLNEIQAKKDSVKTALDYALNASDKLVLNFTSCYLENSFPPIYAGTPALSINSWIVEHIESYQGKTGVVIFDFVTEKLSKAVYGRNFK